MPGQRAERQQGTRDKRIRTDTVIRHNDRVLHSVQHITRWVRDGWADIDVDLLARETRTAPHYFRRIFRDATGDPILRFVRRLRLQVAAYRLVTSDQPVIDIALRAGYGSAAAFSRAFKEQFGSCPADARALQPAAPWPQQGVCCQGFRVESRELQTIAFFRHFGQLATVSQAWRRLAAWCAHNGLDFRAAPRVLRCYDEPERYVGEPMRYDAGIVVQDGFQSLNGAGIQVIPATRIVVTRHISPIEFIPFSYMHLVVTARMTGTCPAGGMLPFSTYLEAGRREGALRATAHVGFSLSADE